MTILSCQSSLSLRPLCFSFAVPSKPQIRFASINPSVLSSCSISVAGLRSNHASGKVIDRSRFAAGAVSSDFSGEISESLGDVAVFTASGQKVLFKDLWDQKDGIAVVALLRHFGCPCCWELASALKDAIPRLDAAGVKLIAVGVGTPDKARILGSRLPFPMDSLYADPERQAYDVLGLYHGFARTFFNPASAQVLSRFDALREATKNYTIEATPNDRNSVLQQGGMFVFKGKELLYARKDEGTGDHAPLDDIFNVCCNVPIA